MGPGRRKRLARCGWGGQGGGGGAAPAQHLNRVLSLLAAWRPTRWPSQDLSFALETAARQYDYLFIRVACVLVRGPARRHAGQGGTPLRGTCDQRRVRACWRALALAHLLALPCNRQPLDQWQKHRACKRIYGFGRVFTPGVGLGAAQHINAYTLVSTPLLYTLHRRGVPVGVTRHLLSLVQLRRVGCVRATPFLGAAIEEVHGPARLPLVHQSWLAAARPQAMACARPGPRAGWPPG